MLDIIDGEGLCNVCAVVTRYFGGVLLGTGGLVRAYSKALKDAAVSANRAVMIPCTVFSCSADYTDSARLSKLISDMSGDHGSAAYDEVNVMRLFAAERGVKEDDIFTDHAGFSTYDSIYRAKNIFEADNIIIVSQKYHLHRALYIAERLGVNAVGVSANLNPYGGQLKREIREILARDKDFFKCIIKPESEYMGDKIPVSGDGRSTIG